MIMPNTPYRNRILDELEFDWEVRDARSDAAGRVRLRRW